MIWHLSFSENTHGQIILVFPRRYIFVNDAVVFFILEDQSNPSTHPPSHFENSEKTWEFLWPANLCLGEFSTNNPD